MRINITSFLFIVVSFIFTPNVFAKEINIYSHRQPFLINPFLELFTQETGIKTNVVYSKKGLAQRLKAEGENSPADVILTVDIGRLYIYDDLNLLAPVESQKLNNNIPVYLRSPDNTWFGLSKRARVIVVNKNKISEGEITRLEDLADSRWKGQICSRPGSHVYNRGIMASVLAAHGEEKAEEWAKKLVSNFTRKPQGNDRSQIMAVANGEADLAVANSYYIGIMLSGSAGEEQLEAAKKVSMIFPNQSNRGAHINISGAGILKNSPNEDNANLFLEFLLSKRIQKNMVDKSYEYPIHGDVMPSKEIASFGVNFKSDQTSVKNFGELNPVAVRLMDRSGWK